MKIKKEELQKALEKVKPGLANKEIIEQSTHFAFMGDRVVTYNDEISISCLVPNLDLVGAISAQELYSFLSKSKDLEIDVAVTENEIRLNSGKSKVGLVLQAEIKLPLHELGEIEDWIALPADFISGLSFCRFSCSRDMSRPILTCVHVSPTCMESSDNSRFTYKLLAKDSGISEFLIPGTSVADLCKYAVVEMATSKGWVHFRTADQAVTFSCRVFEDEYPNTTPILKMEEDVTSIILPQGLNDILDRAYIFAKGQFDVDTMITVTLVKQKIKIAAKNNAGWFEEELAIRYKGDEIVFMINPTFLAEMLGKTKTCQIGTKKIKFGNIDEEGWVHIIGLVVK